MDLENMIPLAIIMVVCLFLLTIMVLPTYGKDCCVCGVEDGCCACRGPDSEGCHRMGWNMSSFECNVSVVDDVRG